MSNVLLSIVIPTLNEEDYLPNLLQNLKEQTDKNFEVIIVDGNSIDTTREKALAFSKFFSVTVIKSKKQNVSYQRNMGAEVAHGKYLFFLDADTTIKPNALEKTLFYIKKDSGLLYLPYPKPSRESLTMTSLFSFAVTFVLLSQKLRRPLAFGPAIIIEKELFKKIGRFNEEAYVSEEHSLVAQAYKAKVKARFLPDVKVAFSLRRFDTEGKYKVVGKYIALGFMTFFTGVIYKSSIKYSMLGGKKYKPHTSVPSAL